MHYTYHESSMRISLFLLIYWNRENERLCSVVYFSSVTSLFHNSGSRHCIHEYRALIDARGFSASRPTLDPASPESSKPRHYKTEDAKDSGPRVQEDYHRLWQEPFGIELFPWSSHRWYCLWGEKKILKQNVITKMTGEKFCQCIIMFYKV